MRKCYKLLSEVMAAFSEMVGESFSLTLSGTGQRFNHGAHTKSRKAACGACPTTTKAKRQASNSSQTWSCQSSGQAQAWEILRTPAVNLLPLAGSAGSQERRMPGPWVALGVPLHRSCASLPSSRSKPRPPSAFLSRSIS